VPLARVVAQYQNELPRFFKRYQIQPVWRADRPARGRFREFYQCDIDAIGSTSPVVEADVLAGSAGSSRRWWFGRFRGPAEPSGVLTALLEAAGVPRPAGDALVALDKLDKIARTAWEGVAARGIRSAGARPAVFTRRRMRRIRRARLRAACLPAHAGLREPRRDRPAAVDRRRDGPDRSTRASRGAVILHGRESWEIAVEGIGSLGGGGRTTT
jgi:hypothetical protein